MEHKPVVAMLCSGLGIANRGMESRASETASMLDEQGLNVILVGGGRPISPLQQREPCIPRHSFVFGGRYSLIPIKYRIRVEETTFSYTVGRWGAGMDQDGLLFFVFQPRVARQLMKLKRKGRLKAPIMVTNGFTHYPRLLKAFEFVHVLAPYYIDLANRLGIDTRRWYFAPQVVDTNMFRPLANLRIRETLGIAQDEFVVLCVGAIDRYKRIDHAIREFSTLRKSLSKAKLLIVGEVESESAAIVELGRSMLGKDVIFRVARHSTMPEVYAAGDVFVLPTRREITGNVFTEAMASGVPAIGDDYEVTRWIIGDGGDTVDMRRTGELASLLETYAKDDSYRKSRARNAHERALEVFSKQVVVPQYLRMFESAIREGHS